MEGVAAAGAGVAVGLGDPEAGVAIGQGLRFLGGLQGLDKQLIYCNGL